MTNSEELQKIEAAIRAQEALLGQGILPDEQIHATLDALRSKLAAFQAEVEGPGTVAQGDNSTAIGQGGVQVGGNVNGDVVTGVKIEERHFHAQEDADPGELRLAYLNHLFESASQLSLSGIDPKAASNAQAQINLSAVYTALLTLTPEAHEQLERGQVSPRGETRRLSALELLDRHPRLVLLGDPGSGKSTFVNFVAMCLAGQTLEGTDANLALLTAPLPVDDEDRQEKPNPQPWGHGALLPVRVILRDFAARGLPPTGERATAKHLWDFIAAELKSSALARLEMPLAQELIKKGGLLLLDGLDEVPEAEQRRAQIKQAVEDFAGVFRKCRILVTSRTYAYQKQDWRLGGFQEAVLAPFTPAQIRQFVTRWYAHIAMLRSLNPEDARGRAELLNRAIFSSDRLRGLAERPLLLTLMASLHAWRGGSLPEKREELYADTVDLLLDWWEQPKVVRDANGQPVVQQQSLLEWLKVDRKKMRDLLNELAYHAHAAQPELIGTADLEEGSLVSGLMRLSNNPEVNPARLVDYLSQRAGLLIPRGQGIYTFPHRTFQEYLTACYLTDHDYPDQIAGMACEEVNRWREVMLLAGAKAGRGTPSAAWSLVDALCFEEVGPESEETRLWGAHLAGQVLAETVDLSAIGERNRPKLERVQRGLVQVLKTGKLPVVERVDAGNTLAALGDPRFDAGYWHLPAEPCFGFVRIPAGKFIMGSDPSRDPQADDDEQPQHEVDIPYDYYMARFPVTAAQYRAFVDESQYETSDYDSLKGISNHPVVWVRWRDALAYCHWLDIKLKALSSRRLAESGSEDETRFWRGLSGGQLLVTLPSEAEWEKAARGADGRIYPWRGEYDPDKANTSQTGIGMTSPVGCFPGGASPYGLLDMSGNVWEWTRSVWDTKKYPYPYVPGDGREDIHPDAQRVLRGGSFYDDAGDARCASRSGLGPDLGGYYIGFRVVVSQASPHSGR